MAKGRKLLPFPNSENDKLTRGYGKLAKQLEFWSKGKLDRQEATEYAHAIQQITSLHQRGSMSNDEFADYFYEIYDELLDDYGVDMHDKDFYPSAK